MTHFNEKGKIGMREKLAKLESREERDLLHCLPPPLVVFSLQTFSKPLVLPFFLKRHTFRKSSARSHIKQTFLAVARSFAGGVNVLWVYHISKYTQTFSLT